MYKAQEYDIALTLGGTEWRLIGRTMSDEDGSISIPLDGTKTMFKLIRREPCTSSSQK